MKIYRVVVRGQFDGLDEPIRAGLLERAAEHDFLRSAFTNDGTFTYDRQLVAFNIRYEVRHTTDEVSDDEIGAAAVERAAAYLRQRGIGNKRLRATVTDMATIWN